MKVVRGVATVFGVAVAGLVLQLPATAKCPVSDGATLVLRAPVGNLSVDTSVRDFAEVNVSSRELAIHEICAKDLVEYSAGDAPIRGDVEWKIQVPRTVNLDLVTLGGNITMGD